MLLDQTKLLLGINSFIELGTYFISTITNNNNPKDNDYYSTLPKLSCPIDIITTDGNSVPNAINEYGMPLTRMYLDPTDTSFLHNNNNNDCAGTDWIVLAIITFIIHSINWLGRWYVWYPLASWGRKKVWTTTTTSTTTTTNNNNNNNNTINYLLQQSKISNITKRKFGQSATSCMLFIIIAIFGQYILNNKSWLLITNLWAPSIITNERYIMEPDFKFFYLIYAGRFISDLLSVPFEVKLRFDTLCTVLIHHIVTIILVLCSAHVGFQHFGGVIMYFFDWADPPLLLAKLCKYLCDEEEEQIMSNNTNDNEKEEKNNTNTNSNTNTIDLDTIDKMLYIKQYLTFITQRCFECFAILFFLTRNCLYTYVVYYVIKDLKQDGTMPGALTCKILCSILVILQSYWFYLIIQAIIRQSKSKDGKLQDVRENKNKKNKNKKE